MQKNTKAVRQRVRNVIAEQLETFLVEKEAAADTRVFRLIISTQIYENYGAHDWDGTGLCPQRWKAKGGEDYQRVLGSAMDVLRIGSHGINKLVAELSLDIETSNDSWREYVVCWEVTSELTASELRNLEMKDLIESENWEPMAKQRYLSLLESGPVTI